MISLAKEEGNEEKRGLLTYTKYILFFTILLAVLNIVFIIQISDFHLPNPSGKTVEIQPIHTFDEFRCPSLEVLPEYFIITYLSVPQNTSFGKSMKIVIELKNKGKFDIQNVFIQLFVVDPLGITRGSLSGDMNNMYEIKFSKLKKRPWYNPFREETYYYRMPSSDQKIFGTWNVYCFVRNSEEELISCAIYPIEVKEPLNYSFLLFEILIISFVGPVIYWIFIRRTYFSLNG